MKEIKGNIFEQLDADAICVTTNGIVKANGELVMGAGIAKQFAERFPGLAADAGEMVDNYGNICQILLTHSFSNRELSIIAFPTKHHWKDQSDLALIARSAHQLVQIANKEVAWDDGLDGELIQRAWKKIVLPRPGCGLGGLKWEDVKRVIEPILDDRFYIITP